MSAKLVSLLVAAHCDFVRERYVAVWGGLAAGRRDALGAGGIDIELVVFGEKDIKHGPSSPVDGKPMRRATYNTVETLLSESAQPSFE